MTLYEKNLKTLANYYPKMDDNIETARKQVGEIEVIEEISQDGETIFKIRKEGHCCYLAGKRNAKLPPHEWLLEQGELSENYTFIFMGIGNVGYLRELIEHVDVRLNIIIYEPSLQIFTKALEQLDLERGMEKHLIAFWVEGLAGMSMENLDQILNRMMMLERLKSLQLFVLPNYDVLFEEACEQLLKKCENIARNQRVAYNTAVNFSKITTTNALRNARHLCNGYKTTQLFRTIPDDIPGIVVAAGPSLNKNIKELKKAKGRAFIIAVDTALKPLLREGIIPDMFFIVDAEKPMSLVEQEGVAQIPMATTLNATPEILDYHQGMKFFFHEGYGFAEKILRRSGLLWGDVCTGGSVATDAFSLLYKIGLKTIILVGQDLALTGNRTHADGTFEEKMPEIDTKNCEWVEGNCEEKVPSRTDFLVFLNWYETSIRDYKEHVKGFRVINATEGGAKIAGTEVMTLKEAIEQVCTREVDIGACLGSLSPMLNEEDRKWARQYLLDIPEQFEQLRKDAEKLGKRYDALAKLGRKDQLEELQYLKVLKKIKAQIKKVEGKEVYQLVVLTMPSAAQIMREEEFEHLEEWKEECQELSRKGKLYAKLVAEAAALLKDEAEKIFKDLREEESETSNED